jgi:hypothetical protein
MFPIGVGLKSFINFNMYGSTWSTKSWQIVEAELAGDSLAAAFFMFFLLLWSFSHGDPTS